MNILIAIWLILFGIMGLVSTDVPKWIVPFAAIAVGLLVLAGAGAAYWKKP